MNLTSPHKLMSIFLFLIFSAFCSFATLEDRLSDKWLIKSLDVDSFKDFEDYLHPNELNPFLIKKHFDLLTNDGLPVATGTERSFIALALCQKCTGLVAVDINPRVKAYNDFNTLLLRISKDREDYLSLRAVNSIIENNFDYTNTVVRIKERVVADDKLDDRLKDYYINNFDNFARIFFNTQNNCDLLPLIDIDKKNKYTQYYYPYSYFVHANYLYDDELFLYISKLVKEKSIISTVGNINELGFLNNENIIAIDTSNICDYLPLTYESDPKIVNDKVRIIWVADQQLNNSFYSYIPRLKNDEMVRKFDQYVAAFEKHSGATIAPDTINTILRITKSSDTDKAPINSSQFHRMMLMKQVLEEEGIETN